MVAPFVIASVNVHDSQLFGKSFSNFLELADSLDLEILDSFLVLDPAFDSAVIKDEIVFRNMKPVIKPNMRGRKNRKKVYQILDEFEPLKEIYKGRIVIERCFAWEDTYRRLATRYDRLNETFNGFRFLAYALINFRWFFGRNL